MLESGPAGARCLPWERSDWRAAAVAPDVGMAEPQQQRFGDVFAQRSARPIMPSAPGADAMLEESTLEYQARLSR